jgi:hypothetical protein
MIRTHLGRSRVRESRMLGSVGAKLNGLATRPSPERERFALEVLSWGG